jgi:hypothetical protein
MSFYIDKGGEIIVLPGAEVFCSESESGPEEESAERTKMDSVVDAMVRNLAEFHIEPFMDALAKMANPSMTEIVTGNINGYYAGVMHNE